MTGTAFAAPAAVSASISGDPVAPGRQASLSFSISPTQRTLASFTLRPPDNWRLVSETPSPSLGSVVNNQLVVGGLSIGPSSSVTVTFDVLTGCKSGNWNWTVVEALDSQGRTYNTTATSDLTTNVNANCSLDITTEPTNAVKDTLIAGEPFDASTSFVEVALKNAPGQTVTYFPVDVTFDLATGPDLAPGSLTAATRTTVDGVATFSGPPETLKISTLNDPQFTDYKLTPKTVGTYAGITGDPSLGFDIWETQCSGSGCSVNLRGVDRDTYTTRGNDILSASTLPSSVLSSVECPGQKLIFPSNVFVHETNGTAPVFVRNHITKQDLRAAGTNFGQAHVDWCVGLKPGDPGLNNGGTYRPVDLDGDTVTDLFVGFAPPCPSKSPELSAPCIVSQSSDGLQGSITTGYLPGGDPPRRT